MTGPDEPTPSRRPAPGPDLRITLTTSGANVVVRLSGELDVVTVTAFDRVVADVFAGSPPPVLVVDLADLTFADCAGLSGLVVARNRATASGTSLVLAQPRPNVARTLSLTGLDRTFTVATDRRAPPDGGRTASGGEPEDGSRWGAQTPSR